MPEDLFEEFFNAVNRFAPGYGSFLRLLICRNLQEGCTDICHVLKVVRDLNGVEVAKCIVRIVSIYSHSLYRELRKCLDDS